ncbi:MAG: hypothetical protein ABIK22_04825, partial [candidate division WOR-3 bacterium]
ILAIVLRLVGHGFRPLLYLVILFVLSGLLFFAAGFLGESIASVNDRLENIEHQLRQSGDRRTPPDTEERAG